MKRRTQGSNPFPFDTPSRKEVKQFLEMLFPNLDGSFIEVWRINGSGQVFSSLYENVEQVIQAVPKTIEEQDGFNVHFGVCPRSRQEGRKNAIKHVRCLWADLDAKVFDGWKKAVRRQLREFRPCPTITVDSGHGYHAYWLLEEPETITRPEDVSRIEVSLKDLASALKADPSATKIASSLRLPGTFNLKDPSTPVPVTVVHCEPGRQHTLSSIRLVGALRPLLSCTKGRKIASVGPYK